MKATRSIRLLAGSAALERISREGLQAHQISAIAGAAGGPKGLALLALDEWLFGQWLPGSPRHRLLAGASIGAWRMAAAVHPEGVKATRRLGEAYLELQRYSARPSPTEVAEVCRAVAAALLGEASRPGVRDETDGCPLPSASTDHPWAGARVWASPRPLHQLAIITARARGPLAGRTDRRAFAHCAWSNLRGREQLGRHLQRVVFTGSPWQLPRQPSPEAVHGSGLASPRGPGLPDLNPFDTLADGFQTTQVALTAENLEDALLASGSIPLICEPVQTPAGAPEGLYWDGGLIDYHLHLPWSQLDGLVLVPHFTRHLTPGWLDKSLPWRRRGPAKFKHWLDNVLIVAPSAALLARLPNGKLPDRQDFPRYGLRHDERIRDWRRAMAECQAMVDDLVAFVRQPDPAQLELI